MNEIITDIPVDIKAENVLKALRLKVAQPRLEQMARDLLAETLPLARPKAIFTVCYIDKKGDDTVEVEGQIFRSRVLRKNLENAERVFPYIATCGTELYQYEAGTDALRNLCLDAIRTLTVGAAMNYVFNRLKSRYALGRTAHMNPGSLADWPITEQRPLFALFHGEEKQTGVELTAGCMMRPMKSVSGLVYPTESRFESCQLCPRQDCPGRRAPYSAELVRQYGI